VRVCVVLLACVVPLAPGFAQNAGQAHSAGAVRARRARPDEFFAHPEALCKALNPVGIETGEWKQIGMGSHYTPGPFMCEYEGAPASRDAKINKDIATLFRVSGDTGPRADVISIAVTIRRSAARAAAQEEFRLLVASLFQWIGQPEPPGLVRAIAERRYYLSRKTYGLLWFNFVVPDHPGYQRVFWFRLSKSGPG
jgi:hypothetical protein